MKTGPQPDFNDFGLIDEKRFDSSLFCWSKKGTRMFLGRGESF